jgi:hypothetical protein
MVPRGYGLRGETDDLVVAPDRLARRHRKYSHLVTRRDALRRGDALPDRCSR